jgi:hypothetical protein
VQLAEKTREYELERANREKLKAQFEREERLLASAWFATRRPNLFLFFLADVVTLYPCVGTTWECNINGWRQRTTARRVVRRFWQSSGKQHLAGPGRNRRVLTFKNKIK